MIAFILPSLVFSMFGKFLFLLVCVAGLIQLCRVPPGRLRKRAGIALWILLCSHVLQWIANTPLLYIFLHDSSIPYRQEPWNVSYLLVNFGIDLLQVYACWLLVRVAVQALRKLPKKKTQPQES